MEELQVTVIEARDVKNVDSGGKSDPYAVLYLVDSSTKEISSAGKFETKRIRNELSPQWNESFSFGKAFDLRNAVSLQIDVYDYELLGRNELLGSCTIPLESTVQTPEIDQWYSLGEGEIHLSLSRTPNGGSLDPVVNIIGARAENSADESPNLLVATIESAKGLRSLDRGGASDPFVIVKCNSQEWKTSKQKNTNNPVWSQRLKIPVDDSSKEIIFTVMDHDLTSNDFLGRVSIPLSDLLNGKQINASYELFNKALEREEKSRGELMLKLQWIYDPTVLPAPEKPDGFFSSISNTLRIGSSGSSGSSEYDDDACEADDVTPAKSKEELEKEAKEREEAKKELEKELANICIQSGDYTINVHVIEARELQAKDSTGTSDPVVFVEVLGEKQNTEVKYKALNTVWDDLLIYNFRDLDKEQVEMGSIKISVMDANSLQRDELIGAANFDTSYVYSQKDHEIYRKWVALTDSNCSDNVGVQGYLKLSITVLGPGDKMKTHDLEKELAQEKSKGDSVADMVILPPSIEQEVNFLVTTIYHAEALPALDYNVIGKNSIDAYVAASVGGSDEIKTRVHSKKGRRNQLNPGFNEELWLPVRSPSMASSIAVEVRDWDRVGGHDVVARTHHNLKLVEKLRSIPPFWANLYGAPLGLLHGGETVANMNAFSENATTYRGRLLMSLRLESGQDAKMEEVAQKKKALRIQPNQLPATRQYQLRALVILGTEIPKFMSIAHPGKNAKMQVTVSCGLTEISTVRSPNIKGVVQWNEYLESKALTFPTDPAQIPDVFVYLTKGKPGDRKQVSYRRFSAQNLLKDQMKQPATWLLMKEDLAVDALDDDEFPGSILIRLGFVPVDEIGTSPRHNWKEDLETMKTRIPYHVRVNIFQGQSLPAADANGLLDPYLKVRLLGHQEKTQVVKKTRDPCWYETKVFNVDLPPLAFAPQIALRLFDWEANPLDFDDYVGSAFVPIQDGVDLTRANASPSPKWYRVLQQEDGDCEGQILASVEYINKATWVQPLPPTLSIVPTTRTAYLELTVLGLRNLQPYKFLPINMPYIDFFLGSKDQSKNQIMTERSKRPSGTNPNYLQRVVREVQLPENALFSPRLNVFVKDTRLGGFHVPCVGVCAIDMTDKIPWSVSYSPPQQAVAEIVQKRTIDQTVRENNDAAASNSEAADTGAGVFGALKHLEIDIVDVKSQGDGDTTVIDVDDTEGTPAAEEEPSVPKYMIDRQVLDEELESYLTTTPFETYDLHLGQGDNARTVGVFKGLVRVMMNKTDPPLYDAKLLLNPLTYQVRVYVLNGNGFRPMDVGSGGRLGKSDPYLKLSLGKDVVNDVKNYIEDTTDPDFYRMFEFKATLPGASRLEIAAYDYDFLGKDDLIGRTVIDLEDRLFDRRWQIMGQEHETQSRYRPRPIEKRTLFVPTSNASMGNLRLWVDILTPVEATAYPALDISLPPPKEFELRVVIWKTRDVVSFDTITDQNDLFCKCWLEGADPQETDIHWRAKKGKGSFNWRMKFPLVLGHKQFNSMFPYFHLQLWDKDVFSFSDAIAESVLDLKTSFQQAVATNQRVVVFPTVQTERTKTQEKNEAAIESIKQLTGLWDVDPMDSTWLKLERLNQQSKTREPMGDVNLSIEIVPKKQSEAMPVGFGRSQPNINPVLPEPNGRLSFSMNPFYVFNELLGPKLCNQLLCCLCCVLIFVIVYLTSPGNRFRPHIPEYSKDKMAQYGKSAYWDERYTKDPEPFDWYQRYAGIKDLVGQYIKKTDNILMSGAGNSRLTEDLLEDGFQTIANIDISQIVIDQMVEKYKDREGMTWQQMNVCSLEFPDESFDAVFDKGTLDSILCGEGSTANVAKMCQEIARVLKPSGVYFIVSYGVPDNRLSYLENDDYGWTVTVHTVQKPTVSAVQVADANDANAVHYIYACQKGTKATS